MEKSPFNGPLSEATKAPALQNPSLPPSPAKTPEPSFASASGPFGLPAKNVLGSLFSSLLKNPSALTSLLGKLSPPRGNSPAPSFLFAPSAFPPQKTLPAANASKEEPKPLPAALFPPTRNPLVSAVASHDEFVKRVLKNASVPPKNPR